MTRVSTPVTRARAFGVTAGLDPGIAHDLAARCSELSYHSLWSNDDPDAPGLETLAHFATGATALALGVGVLPLDRYRPEDIVREVDRLGLDPARLWIGIGAGRLYPQLDAVRNAVNELRERMPPATRIVVAAMRPRLAHVGATVADGVLFNWLPPEQAVGARAWVRGGAAHNSRNGSPISALYVRVAVGPGAVDRLRAEEGRYREINEGHRAHFAALNAPLGSVGVAAADASEVRTKLDAYSNVVDLPIARALADPDITSLLAVAEAAAPRREH